MREPRFWRKKKEREREENKAREAVWRMRERIELERDQQLAELNKQIEFGVSAKEASEGMANISASAKSFEEAMKRATQQINASWTSSSFAVYQPSDRKYISAVQFNWNSIDVTSFSDPRPRFVRGPLEILDQDGDPVPEKLRRMLLWEYEQGNVNEERVNKILSEWNQGMESEDPSTKVVSEKQLEHISGCQYRGDHSFACICQPPTLFGKTFRWLCECCLYPRAKEQFTLCEMCEAHEYSAVQQNIDHEVAGLA